MQKYDLLSGLIWLIVGISLSIESVELGVGEFVDPGPGFISLLTGILLALFGGILSVSSGLRTSKRDGEIKDQEMSLEWNRKKFLLPSLTVVILFGYILLLETMGYLLTTFLCFFPLFKFYEPKKLLNPLIFAILTAILSYILFMVWLKVQLPKGILGI